MIIMLMFVIVTVTVTQLMKLIKAVITEMLIIVSTIITTMIITKKSGYILTAVMDDNEQGIKDKQTNFSLLSTGTSVCSMWSSRGATNQGMKGSG